MSSNKFRYTENIEKIDVILIEIILEYGDYLHINAKKILISKF